jgi:hypothetical protein
VPNTISTTVVNVKENHVNKTLYLEVRYKRIKLMLKARGLILIDYELPNGYVDAAAEQTRLEEAMQNLVRGNNRVVYFQCDVKERRGDGKPDLRKLKIRTS